MVVAVLPKHGWLCSSYVSFCKSEWGLQFWVLVSSPASEDGNSVSRGLLSNLNNASFWLVTRGRGEAVILVRSVIYHRNARSMIKARYSIEQPNIHKSYFAFFKRQCCLLRC